MGESLHISNCVINKLLSSKSNIQLTNSVVWNSVYFKNNNINSYTSMEDLINHFLH
jgi:hypothetical protein